MACRFRGRRLPINGSVIGFRLRKQTARFELSRTNRAIVLPNHEPGHELEQELLFQSITETVVIAIGAKFSRRRQLKRNEQKTATNPSVGNSKSQSRHSSCSVFTLYPRALPARRLMT
jgi:hypothetical protein